METKTVKLSRLNIADYNPRQDLQPGDSRYENIKKSVDKFGLVVPIIVNRNGMRIISGHQRYKILKSQGVTETEVIIVELDEEKEKLLNLALNKIRGQWDMTKLSELLNEFDEEQLSFTGFSAEEIEALTEEYDEALEDVIGETEPEDEEKDAQEGTEEDREATEEGVLVYLSFEKKEDALAWLEAHKIKKTFGATNNININVKGGEYDVDGD